MLEAVIVLQNVLKMRFKYICFLFFAYTPVYEVNYLLCTLHTKYVYKYIHYLPTYPLVPGTYSFRSFVQVACVRWCACTTLKCIQNFQINIWVTNIHPRKNLKVNSAKVKQSVGKKPIFFSFWNCIVCSCNYIAMCVCVRQMFIRCLPLPSKICYCLAYACMRCMQCIKINKLATVLLNVLIWIESSKSKKKNELRTFRRFWHKPTQASVNSFLRTLFVMLLSNHQFAIHSKISFFFRFQEK